MFKTFNMTSRPFKKSFFTFPSTFFILQTIDEMLYSSTFQRFSTMGITLETKQKQALKACLKKIIWG
jgi:hypothetical protein